MEALISASLDGLMVLVLLGLARGALASADLFRGIALFIAFGLVMALAWVRLKAPDIALAEAAIGAGLTGALLLAAYARLRAASADGNPDRVSRRPGLQYISVSLLVLLIAVVLAYAAWTLPQDGTGLGSDVATNLERSGVSNPVTAVLLNFRSYDTLLEVMVLLVALLGAWSLGVDPARREPAAGPVLDTLSRLLTPLLILVAAYLLWAGAHAPGGAFQAGAVLAAAGVLMLLAGWRLPAALAALPLRLVLVTGPAIFLLLAVLALLLEGKLLQFAPEWAGGFILIIETTAMISIGVTLVALFAGAAPDKGGRQ